MGDPIQNNIGIKDDNITANAKASFTLEPRWEKVCSDEEAKILADQERLEILNRHNKELKELAATTTPDVYDNYPKYKFNSTPPSRLKRSAKAIVKSLDKANIMGGKYNLLELRDSNTGEEVFAINNEYEFIISDKIKKDEAVADIARALTQFMSGKDVDRIKYKAALIHCLAAMRTAEDSGCVDHLNCADDGGEFWHKAKRLAQECFNVRE